MREIHMASGLLFCAGGLMALAGILLAVSVGLGYGGALWAAASYMFFGAYHFRQMENQNNQTEESGYEQETL